MEQRWLAVAAMMLIALALLGAVVASQLNIVQTSSGSGEVSATCTSNSFAISENLSGAFICAPVSWTGLVNFPSNCPSGSFVYGISTTLSCTSPSQTASVIRLMTTCSTSSVSYINCTGFSFTVQPNEVVVALLYESISITTTGGTANYRTRITLPSGASVLNACYQYVSTAGVVNTCSTSTGISFNPLANTETLLTSKYVLNIGSGGGSVQVQLASGSSTATVKIYNQSVIFVNYYS